MSPTLLRRYGAPGFELAEHGETSGCPRQYKAHYIDRDRPGRSEVLDYGLIIHRALHLMEAAGMDPEEALEAAWAEGDYAVVMPLERYEEARADFRAYLERGSTPLDRFATLATELRLDAELYVDPDHGPIHLQGVIDRISIDYDEPDLVHIGDWKSSRRPPSEAGLLKDVTAKAYTWLAYQCLDRLIPPEVRSGTPRIIFHLDAIKWRELPPVYFSPDDLDAWHGWTVAIVRHILRDETAEPRLNPGCAYCPVRDTCPAFQELPAEGRRLLKIRPELRDDLAARWVDEAHLVATLLAKAVQDVDNRFKADALAEGVVAGGPFSWRRKPNWVTRVDLPRLHDALGDEFYAAVKSSRAAVERAVRQLPADVAVQALRCVYKVVDGETVERVRR